MSTTVTTERSALSRSAASRPATADSAADAASCGTTAASSDATVEPAIDPTAESTSRDAATGGSPSGVSAETSSGAEAVETSSPAEPADPFDDADALEELEHEIATLAAHIAAATHRFLVLVAEFDRRRGWKLGGHRSCAHWLHVATGLDRGAAREKVRTARALVELPKTSRAMARGELSYSKVRALTRVATPACEEELLEVAKGSTTAALERVVRAFRRHGRADEATVERARHRSRRLSVFPDEEGMYVIRGRLSAEVGAALMRAVEAASDALYRGSARKATTAGQRRADALGLLAERALAAGFGPGRETGEGSGRDERTGDVSAETPDDRDGVPRSGTRAERYQVMVHVQAAALAAGPGGGEPEPAGAEPGPDGCLDPKARALLDGGRSGDAGSGACDPDDPGSALAPACCHLEDGTRLPPETARRLACDAARVRVLRDAEGRVLDVGRRTRTIPPALRRALEVRDRGCRFPGCGLRFTDGHHIVHWARGGETALDNLILLCRHHHRLVHEEGWRVELWGPDRHPAFVDPRGRHHVDPRPLDVGRRLRDSSVDPDAAPAARVELPERPAAALVDAQRDRGVTPDGWSLRARWEREADIPWALQARTLEALDEAHFGQRGEQDARLEPAQAG